MKKTMEEWKEGDLHSGSKKGPVVKDHKQAIAIGLNEEGKGLNKGLNNSKHYSDMDIEELRSYAKKNKLDHTLGVKKLRETVGNHIVDSNIKPLKDKLEKADNEGGDSKAIMHTNGGDPVDVSDLIITSGNDHFVDVIDPATGKPKFKKGDSVKYKLEDNSKSYTGTLTSEKHPDYDQAWKVDRSKKKKQVEVA